MEARSLKISWKIMMVPPIYVLLLGLCLIVFPGPSIAKNYQLFMGHPWADFVASNARLVIFLSMLNQLIGVQAIGYAIVTMAIILKAYRRREKWAWYVLLAGNTLGFGHKRYHVVGNICWVSNFCKGYFCTGPWLMAFHTKTR